MKRLVYLLALGLSAGALAQEKKEEAKPASGVNWEGQVLKATGSGAPDMKASNPAQARLGAETAAKMDAFRNLLAQAKGIQISAGSQPKKTPARIGPTIGPAAAIAEKC